MKDNVSQPESILDRIILGAGPPRSGTTLLAKVLNSHARIVTAIDNSVYERWVLYYYRSREGIIQDFRTGVMCPEAAKDLLVDDLVRSRHIWGVAPSSNTSKYPKVTPPTRPDAQPIHPNSVENKALLHQAICNVRNIVAKLLSTDKQSEGNYHGLIRHKLPLEIFFKRNLYLCLKSPEICFVLPKLGTMLSEAKFVLTYRPIIEIAESMYRKGFEWSLASYHKRWAKERDTDGELIPPPGVPLEWHSLWKRVTNFQRCTIYASSYVRAMILGIRELPSHRIFLYDHAKFREIPEDILVSLARFLNVSVEDFGASLPTINDKAPVIPDELAQQYEEIKTVLNCTYLMDQLDSLNTA